MYFFPKRKNAHAFLIVLLLYILCAVCIVGIVLEKGAFFSIAGFGSMLAATLITNRNLLTKYLYALTPPQDLHRKNMLAIVRVVGKRKITLAMVNLQSVFAFLPLEEYKALLRERKIKRLMQLSFCPDLFPPNAWVLYSEVGENGTAVLLQCDEPLVNELKSRIAPME